MHIKLAQPSAGVTDLMSHCVVSTTKQHQWFSKQLLTRSKSLVSSNFKHLLAFYAVLMWFLEH